MSHTFEGESCHIHYNSDLSGAVTINGGPGDEGPDEIVTLSGSDLLAFFRHLQEPGRALAPQTVTVPDAKLKRVNDKPCARVKDCPKCGYHGTWRLEWHEPNEYGCRLPGLRAQCPNCRYIEIWEPVDACETTQQVRGGG